VLQVLHCVAEEHVWQLAVQLAQAAADPSEYVPLAQAVHAEALSEASYVYKGEHRVQQAEQELEMQVAQF